MVSVYAIGYVAAALKPGPWMALIKPVNIAGAAFVAAMLVALMTPIADPARLSVANQTARLESGRVEPDDFDFGFLASERSRHWGQTALTTLKSRTDTDRDKRIAELAERLGDGNVYDRGRHSFSERRNALRLVGGGTIPDAALLPSGRPDPIGDCLTQKRQFDAEVAWAVERRRELEGEPDADLVDLPSEWSDGLCLTRLMDLDGDSDIDLLIWSNRNQWHAVGVVIFHALLQETEDKWISTAILKQSRNLNNPDHHKTSSAEKKRRLDDLEEAFANATPLAADRADLLIEGRRLRLTRLQREWQSPQLMRQHLNMIDGREPPETVLQDRPLTNILSNCPSTSDLNTDSTIACYGRHMDITGDGAEEFLLIRLAHDIRNIQIQAYKQHDTNWRQFGQGEMWQGDKLQLRKVEDAIERQQILKTARTRLLNDINIAPPLLMDINFIGTRMTIEYLQPQSDQRSGHRERR